MAFVPTKLCFITYIAYKKYIFTFLWRQSLTMIRIRLCSEVKGWIRIRINTPMRIHNNAI